MIESIEELRTFCRIVDEGSLSAAARSLSVSVNAISRRLAHLEARVGTRLLERTTRSLRLTSDGARFHLRAQRILREVDEAADELLPAHSDLDGLVRVAVHPTLVQRNLFTGLAALLSANPKLQVHLLTRNTAVDPVREGLDVVVWPGQVSHQSVMARRVVVASWVLACAPTYAASRSVPRTPADLEGHVCLRALRDQPERTWTLCNRQGEETTIVPGGNFDADDTETLRRAIYAGMGVGFRPRREVQSEVTQGRLVWILPEYSLRPVPVHLVTPLGRLRQRRVRAVSELIERCMEVLM